MSDYVGKLCRARRRCSCFDGVSAIHGVDGGSLVIFIKVESKNNLFELTFLDREGIKQTRFGCLDNILVWFEEV